MNPALDHRSRLVPAMPFTTSLLFSAALLFAFTGCGPASPPSPSQDQQSASDKFANAAIMDNDASELKTPETETET
ncbi:MAG: hypothetical protein N2C14_30770, partial [Planctomycetales bacterium]